MTYLLTATPRGSDLEDTAGCILSHGTQAALTAKRAANARTRMGKTHTFAIVPEDELEATYGVRLARKMAREYAWLTAGV